MSRLGGPNEVAALSIGVTVDQTTLDASLAQAKQKVETFNRTTTIAPTVIGPMTGGKPATIPTRPSDAGAYNLDVTSGFFPGAGKGQTYQIDTPTTGAATKKVEELDKAHKSLGQTMRDQVRWQRDFISGAKQQIGVITSLISTIGAIAGVAYLAYNAGVKLSDVLFDNTKRMLAYDRATQDATRSTDKFNAARDKTLEGRLQKAGKTPEQIDQIMGRLTEAQKALDAEIASPSRKESDERYIRTASGGLRLFRAGRDPESQAVDRSGNPFTGQIASNPLMEAAISVREAQRQAVGITGQAKPAPTVATSTDTLGDAMRRTADSNVRMMRGEHAVNRDSYSRSLAEPARMAR